MDSMEDSGFDSDQKSQNGHFDTKTESTLTKSASYKALKKAAELQKKIEKQRELAKKAQAQAAAIEHQPKRSFLLPRSRVTVPEMKPLNPDQQPLVTIVTDSEDDEFDLPQTSRTAQKEITAQLIKDGYNLDLEPDDEDLDLIPPRPLNERCTCCQLHQQPGCVIQ
ncbi:protein FAM219A-like [Haliotis rubra]|uniref:protein FAM219A-like n=1 Tax=Haliotis rubra TaxID=36100 RepID=UPI001EE61DBD|nr:protein FAM219A-like [Haliotis rubra]